MIAVFLQQAAHLDRKHEYTLVAVDPLHVTVLGPLLLIIALALCFLKLLLNIALALCLFRLVLIVKLLNMLMIQLRALHDLLLPVHKLQLLILGHRLTDPCRLEHNLVVKSLLVSRRLVLSVRLKLWKRYVHHVLVEVTCHLQVVLTLVTVQV